MRIRILWVAVPTTDGRVIDGILWPILEEVPAILVHGERIVGYLTDFELRPEGLLTADLTLTADVQVTGLAAQVDMDDLRFTGDGVRHYTGRVRAVHLGEDPCWPGMEIV